MQAKKGIVNQRYKTLLVRETAAVQKAHLKKEFELAEASRVAEALSRQSCFWKKTAIKSCSPFSMKRPFCS